MPRTARTYIEEVFHIYFGTEKFIRETEERFKQKKIRGERGRPKN